MTKMTTNHDSGFAEHFEAAVAESNEFLVAIEWCSCCYQVAVVSNRSKVIVKAGLGGKRVVLNNLMHPTLSYKKS